MAVSVYNPMATQFSNEGKYFAQISSDGKLKIWDTVSNSFEQEFTPDFHLISPCTCLHFIQSHVPNKVGSPRKKKRRDSVNNTPNIILGTSSGLLLVYSIAKADLDYKINSETSQSINCLSNDGGIIYSGADNNILVWNLHKRNITSKWVAGPEKIGAILMIQDSNKLLTASKNIKLWDVTCKEVLKTFTGHSSEITLLQYVSPRDSSADAYFISGSKGDRLLNCWNLNESLNEKNAVATCLMEDIVQNLSICVSHDGTTNMAATVRSGVVHIYHHTLNGKCSKPLKPKTTIQVVSDAKKGDVINPIHITAAIYRDDQMLCIGYGSAVVQTFENITISNYKKLQCLLRKDPQKLTSSKQIEISTKVRTPIVGNDVHYLTPQTSSVTIKRKNDGQQEVPMERRLENLTLNKLDGSSKVPKGDNVAQLLVQGLHSKDKTILRTVLSKRDEQVIKNTIKRLPMSVIVPLVEELTTFIQGKTLSTQIGSLWLKNLIMIHAGLLLSNPDLPTLFGKTLNSFETRLSLQQPLNRLKGRLDLLISQVNVVNRQESKEDDVALLVFNDKDSSDSDNDGMEFEVHSDSENDWSEASTDGENENGAVDNEDEENESNNGPADDSDEAMSS